jgi:ABC-type transporter Mla subunit MlaD
MMQRLEAADLPGLVDNANTLVKALAESATTGDIYRTLVEAADLLTELRGRTAGISPGVVATIEDARATMHAVRELLEGREMRAITAGAAAAGQRLPQTAAAIEQAARRLDATMADANRDIGPMLRDLRITADNLKAITEQMRQFPSQVLFGAPPPREPAPAGQPGGAR